jgi:hypothetical protein
MSPTSYQAAPPRESIITSPRSHGQTDDNHNDDGFNGDVHSGGMNRKA